MAGTVFVQRPTASMWVVGPSAAPVRNAVAEIDTAILEVPGGHLEWRLLEEEPTPTAIFDDVARAQQWLWAVFGEEVALAVADLSVGQVASEPAVPELVSRARRLAYALWAARWWPASIIDDIPPLDAELLGREIGTLALECESILDDEFDPVLPPRTSKIVSGADDYALAAGSLAVAERGTLVLVSGIGGADWRQTPPGVVDASERALTWDLFRDNGTTTIRVAVVAAPDLDPDLPDYLHPHARIVTASGSLNLPLRLRGDTWQADAAAPPGAETAVTVSISVPGFGTEQADASGDAVVREQVRMLVRARLRRVTTADPSGTTEEPLLAEVAAVASDLDF
ncbi:hypothetical protein [Antrihabitans spumae]|jgi:hypothetical protein|uniref:Uncharacterized protein n=1 Tax=Antrihabitans spumae TaxID=3373370 RepID=A0ABW7K3X5_9NOCA